MATAFQQALAEGKSWSEAEAASRGAAATTYAAGDPSRLIGTQFQNYAADYNLWNPPKPVAPTPTPNGTTGGGIANFNVLDPYGNYDYTPAPIVNKAPALTYQPRQDSGASTFPVNPTTGSTKKVSEDVAPQIGQNKAMTFEQAYNLAFKTGGRIVYDNGLKGYTVIARNTTPGPNQTLYSAELWPAGTSEEERQSVQDNRTAQTALDKLIGGELGETENVPELVTFGGQQGYWTFGSNGWQFNSVTNPADFNAPSTPQDQGQTYTDSAGNTWMIDYDYNSSGRVWDRNDVKVSSAPEPMSEYQKQQLELQKQQADWQKRYEELMLEYQQQQQSQSANLQSAQLEAERQRQQEMINWYQQQQQAQLAWEQQQQQMQLEAERQEQLASLKANPGSWLEYAALSGQSPTVQPWMLPLGYEDYGFQLGSPVPGWNAGATSGTGLPELMTPSAQLWARMSPSAQQQYQAYQASRTGMSPSDVQYQLWAGAPGGAYGGLRQLQYAR